MTDEPSAPPVPPMPPERLPTLTEAIDLGPWAAPPRPETRFTEALAAELPLRSRAQAHEPPPSEAQVVGRVMEELQHQIDVMLEYRLREVLGPLLARAADSVVRDARSELASTLRDIVARAVQNELARDRGR